MLPTLLIIFLPTNSLVLFTLISNSYCKKRDSTFCNSIQYNTFKVTQFTIVTSKSSWWIKRAVVSYKTMRIFMSSIKFTLFNQISCFTLTINSIQILQICQLNSIQILLHSDIRINNLWFPHTSIQLHWIFATK